MVNFEAGVRSSRLAFALAALSTAAAVHAQPLRLYVDDDAPAGGDGRLWSRAFQRVQDALTAARARPDLTRAVEIVVAQGTYLADSGLTASSAFVLTSGVSILGGFAGLSQADPNQRDIDQFVSVLSGDALGNDTMNPATRSDNAQAVLNFAPQAGQVEGVTITGGGIAVRQTMFGRVVLSRCRISRNLIASPEQTLLMVNQATLTECIIDGNTSEHASLISAVSSRLIRCIVADNRVNNPENRFEGSLIRGDWPTPTFMVACLVASNTLNTPQMIDYNVQMLGCTVVENTVWFSLGRMTAENCVFARNLMGLSAPVRRNAVQGYVESSLFEFESDYESHWTQLNFYGNPQFVSPEGSDGDPRTWADNDYRLRPTSPAIDRASTRNVIYAVDIKDIRGLPPADDLLVPNLGVGAILYLDAGAFEYQPGEICIADFDGSGAISGVDIFAFINAWFAGDPLADVNRSGTLNVLDIIDFLNAWFNGC
ncbi:MAG: hypothetical protein K2W85_09255 [Phycisphaerales bacterium]|nr:hypothetical protein [Phycisphaerales bacterium]